MLNVKMIREDFPTLKKCVYLANCAETPMPLQVADAIVREGIIPKLDKTITKDFFGPVDRAREACARFINAHPDEICRARGTTESINIVATMIDWRPTDNVIVNDLEFPSNVYPFQRQAKLHGFEVRTVNHREGVVDVDDIIARMDGNTRMVAVSMVSMANGYRPDIEKLGAETRRRGILLEVDGIQAFGSRKVDVQALNADFFCIGGHKYALGPSGTAMVYVRRELIGQFEPMYMGPWQQKEIFDFSYRQYDLADTARRFEFGGHPNELGLPGFAASVEYLDNIGADVIEERCGHLVRHIVACCKKYGIAYPSWADDPKYHGSYIGVATRNRPEKDVVAALEKEHGIFCALSTTTLGQRIRIAPSFFNTEEEIELAVKTIGQLDRQ